MSSVEKLVYDVEFFSFYDRKFIRKRHHYSWRELRYACHALGLPPNSFDRAVKQIDLPGYIKENCSEYGITQIGVRDLVDARCLDDPFSESTNLHPVEYQCQSLLTSLELLEDEKVTFSMLHAARLLFFFYEQPADLKGIRYDMGLVKKIMKYLGLILPTKQLEHHLREQMFAASIANRLQFFEFIRIVPKCSQMQPEVEKEKIVPRLPKQPARPKTAFADPFPCDPNQFDRILSTPEMRAQTRLDNDFEKRQYLFLDLFESSDVIGGLFKIDSTKGQFGAHKSTVITREQNGLKQNNRLQSRLLRLDLTTGRESITLARSGHLRSRNKSVPPSRLSMYLEENYEDATISGPSRWTKLQNVMKFARLAAREAGKNEPVVPVLATDKFSQKRQKIPEIVSENDREELIEKISELTFRLNFPESSSKLGH